MLSRLLPKNALFGINLIKPEHSLFWKRPEKSQVLLISAIGTRLPFVNGQPLLQRHPRIMPPRQNLHTFTSSTSTQTAAQGKCTPPPRIHTVDPLTAFGPNRINHSCDVAFTAHRSPPKWVAGFIRPMHAGMLSRGPGRLIRNSERNGGTSMCQAEKAITSECLTQNQLHHAPNFRSMIILRT